MLMAPVDPFTNTTLPNPVDPKLPGSFNRSRTVWIPPATRYDTLSKHRQAAAHSALTPTAVHVPTCSVFAFFSVSWEDAFSGEVVSGGASGKTVQRSEVPLAHTVLYHRRPSLAVTARYPARNAATTDLSALVIEAFTSGGDAATTLATTTTTTTTTRELHLPSSGADNEAPIHLELTEHAAAVSAAVDDEGSGCTRAGGRRLSVRIVDPAAQLHRDQRRSWLVRVHLGRGERLLSPVTTATITTVIDPSSNSAIEQYSSPFGGEGKAPPPLAGAVVEMEATEAAALEMCVDLATGL
eukprot:SAG22_NODE_1873_length_3393_cov_2.088342_1_plen_297_part_00